MNNINVISIISPVSPNVLFEITQCVRDIQKHPIEEVRERFLPNCEQIEQVDDSKMIVKVNYSKDKKTIDKVTFRGYKDHEDDL